MTESPTDSITGLYTRAFFLELAEARFAEARRHGYTSSLLIAQVDGYEQLSPLRAEHSALVMTELLRACLRREDMLGRISASQFAILMLHCDAENACAKAEALRSALSGIDPASNGGSVSFGVASVAGRAGVSVENVLTRTSEATARASLDGGNRICLADPVGAASL
ncbi:MAG: diguanylate cyclase [Betaproteobacteria bacterium]|nr:diguanylate cyclase [Betaproteobacteria bacterium]